MITKIKTNNREEWKALRHKYIGGSDAAAVVGLNPYKSAYSLWAEKTGKLPAFEGNLATEVGTFLEDFIAQKFATITGKKVRRENHSLINDKYPFAIANIDRSIVGEEAGLECKDTSELNTRKFQNGEFPSNFYCQCVHYLGVTELKRWYLAVLIGNKDFKIYQLTRLVNDEKPVWCESSVYISDEEITALMQAEKNIYENIKNNIPPAIDGSDSTAQTLGAFYPQSEPQTVDLFAYVSDLETLFNVKAQIKALEAIQVEKENLIKDFMKTAEKGQCEGYSISWATSERKTFDTKRFSADNPDFDLSPYYNTTTLRTFRANKRKAGK